MKSQESQLHPKAGFAPNRRSFMKFATGPSNAIFRRPQTLSNINPCVVGQRLLIKPVERRSRKLRIILKSVQLRACRFAERNPPSNCNDPKSRFRDWHCRAPRGYARAPE